MQVNNQYAPYTLYGASHVNEVSEKVNAALSELYAGWFTREEHFIFSVTNHNESFKLAIDSWDIYASSPDCWVALKGVKKLQAGFLTKMFDADSNLLARTTKLTSAIYSDFIESHIDTLYSLANTVYLKGQNITNVRTLKGSGALLGLVSNGEVAMQIAIGADLIKAICSKSFVKLHSKSADLVSRESVLQNPVVDIHVPAGSAEMTLKDLSMVEVGDVILLDKKLGGKFLVTDAKGRFLANAQLGKRLNQKAIQFIE
ncbi:flagellar motor switch protein [Methylophilaceae bacterium 11]|nr:flagellar motor switch protein [Methylophilaceae bacterium 11]